MKHFWRYLFMLFLIGIISVPSIYAVNPTPKRVDVLVVGDSKVGKTCLRSVLVGEASDTLGRDYTPTKEPYFVSRFVDVNGSNTALLYWDTPGIPDVRQQLITYGANDCPFIVIAVDMSRDTYDPSTRQGVNVVEQCLNDWLVAIRNHHRNAYIIVCGTKKDKIAPAKVQSILAQLTPYRNIGTYAGYFDCVATSSTTDVPSVMQIENIIKRVLAAGPVNLASLPNFEVGTYKKIQLPCTQRNPNLIVAKKSSGCTLL